MAMRRAVAAVALLLGACAGAQAPGAGPSTAAAVRAAPVPVTVDEALGRTDDEASVLLRLSALRAHPLGGRLERFILAWPGWDATLASITRHPVTDLDWLDVVGPRETARQRLLTQTAAADDVIDTNLAARTDASLRVVVRPQPHVVLAAPPAVSPPIEATLHARPLVAPPADDDDILAVDLPRPQDAVPQLPPETRHLVAHVHARPGGGGEAFVELACDDDAAAARLADDLRARVDAVNGLLVRMLTRDLLGGLAIHHEGPKVQLRLPATREQLESILTYAEGLLLPARSGL
jgi:hypothetical protein